MAEKLLDRMRRIIRTRHYSYRTEQSYLGWARRYILFHGKQHPSRLGKAEIEAFLSHLAVDRNVAPSTQNQALNGILFLYRQVLEMDLPWLGDVVRASPRKRVPVVLCEKRVRSFIRGATTANQRPDTSGYRARRRDRTLENQTRRGDLSGRKEELRSGLTTAPKDDPNLNWQCAKRQSRP